MTGGQQFNLRWNNHTNNLARVLFDQFEREEMVDVIITCQVKFIKAHKMVLGACSPYFHDIFSSHTLPAPAAPYPIIILNGFEFEDVQAIIEFMYKGEVMVCENVMPRMLKAAESLQVKGLSNVRSKGNGSPGSRNSMRDEEDEDLGCGREDDRDGEDMESEEDKLLDASKGLNNGLNGGTRRRSRDSQIAELMSKANPVPLHKRRNKRKMRGGANNIAEAKKSNLVKFSNQSASSSSSSSPESSAKQEKSCNDNVFMDQEEDLDILSAINIEPPLLRDIDGKYDSIWENNNGFKGSPSDDKPLIIDEKVQGAVATPLFSTEQKIPRPPNSFMIFANEWRRQLANQFPNESNKEISVRLGLMWKNLSEELKAKYFSAAKQANDDHKKKFPNYHYNPKEARLRKMFKMQQQAQQHLLANN